MYLVGVDVVVVFVGHDDCEGYRLGERDNGDGNAVCTVTADVDETWRSWYGQAVNTSETLFFWGFWEGLRNSLLILRVGNFYIKFEYFYISKFDM